MLGIINKALQSYVCDILGADDWYALCAATPLSADQYEPMLVYPDEETEVLIEAICLASGRTRDDMLEDFGNYVVSQHSSPAVRKLLRLGGETFVDFLYSLEQLHTRGAVLVPDLDLPNLRLEVAGDNQYILHCTEHKPGFGAVLQGILYAMASSYEALIVVGRGGERYRTFHHKPCVRKLVATSVCPPHYPPPFAVKNPILTARFLAVLWIILCQCT